MFTIDTAYATILTQKNQDGNEVLISFISIEIEDAQLKYHEVEKQVFPVFKTDKHFLPYLLKSQTKVITPYPTVRNLFIQKELGEIRSYWMNTLREYDLEIIPTNIVWGQGLCNMVVEALGKDDIEEGKWENESAMYEIEFETLSIYKECSRKFRF